MLDSTMLDYVKSVWPGLRMNNYNDSGMLIINIPLLFGTNTMHSIFTNSCMNITKCVVDEQS